jgi:polyisoprenyl-teichoic acid--peptidoglycan teichoic acid transferase
MKKPCPRLRRYAVLGTLLATLGVVVPDSGSASTQAVLVEFQHAQGVALDSEVVWILAVGSDARPGEDMTRTRGDALQLVGMNTRTGAATSIGVPRDSYVSIPGVGSDRINASLYYGGPQLLGQTIGELVGIEPDYVFVTRFPFFEDMIDDIGGITVDNPTAFPAGKIRLNGYDAMAFSRIRHNLPGGDFDRSANQQRVLKGIQGRIAGQVDTAGFIEGGVMTVLKHTDTDLSPAELFRLAHVIAQVEPGKITGCVVQGGIATINGASVVTPYVADAQRYGDDARDDAVISDC